MVWDVMQRDCVTGLQGLDPGSVPLIVCDSPYNFGQPYAAYKDNKPHDKFLAWLQSWLSAASQALAPHGSLWVFVPDEWADELSVYCRRTLNLTRRRWVIWVFTFGQAARKNFTRSHCHILYFSKSATKFTWNEEGLRVPSARQLVYNDKRANQRGKLPDDTWLLLESQLAPHMGGDRDVWLQSRVCGTFHERQHHSPNQIPLPLMERIVRSTSQPGDLVVDPFLGTGTTGVASVLHGRQFLGFDISAECVAQSRLRIEEALKQVS